MLFICRRRSLSCYRIYQRRLDPAPSLYRDSNVWRTKYRYALLINFINQSINLLIVSINQCYQMYGQQNMFGK